MKQKVSYRTSEQTCKAFNQALSSFDNVDPALVGLTPTGKIIYANHSACKLFGYPREELEGLQIRAITPGLTAADWSDFWLGLDQEDSKPSRTTLHQSGKNKLSVEFRALFNLPSGMKYCLMLIPGKGPAAGAKGGTRSCSLDLVLNSMGNPAFVMNEQHEITLLNQAACQELGTTLAKAAGTTVYDYLPKRQADIVWKHD